MKTCLIFNPQAGTAARIKDFLLHLTGNQRCELRPTSLERGAAEIAREAVKEGFDRLLVAGGDGTVSQAVNGIAPDFDAVELAVLPFGTGNDLARSLGVGADVIDHACEAAFESRVEPIDVIRVDSDGTTSWCVNVAHGGLGGRVAADVQAADKQRWGSLAYWMTSVSRMIDLHEYQVHLDLDDRQIETRTVGVAIANGRYVGGGFPISPRAVLNDGLLDITTVPVLPTVELMAAGLNFTLGRDQHEDRVRHYRSRRVHLTSVPSMSFSIDGEVVRPLDATFEVVPRALRVVVGENPVGLQPVDETKVFVS